MAAAILTFTTDFGDRDTYVGQMKGAALAVEPALCLVDLCHHVPPHDVQAGAWQLEAGYAAFPAGTIHVAVVDPGVGTERSAVAVETERYVFVGPDNGVLSRALERESVRSAHRLVEPRYRGPRRSTTFEGRDVFAPAAAWIARGIPLSAFGPAVSALGALARPTPVLLRGGSVALRVLAVDTFGNVVVDLRADELERALGRSPAADSLLRLVGSQGTARGLRSTYGSPGSSEPFLLINSAGYLEAALGGARAAERLGLAAGDEARLELEARPATPSHEEESP